MGDLRWSRREFVEFFGRGAVGAMALKSGVSLGASLPFTPIKPSLEDALRVADGFQAERLIGQGELFGKGLSFGDCNDYIAFTQLDPSRPDEGLLWINHEDVTPMFTSGY